LGKSVGLVDRSGEKPHALTLALPCTLP